MTHSTAESQTMQGGDQPTKKGSVHCHDRVGHTCDNDHEAEQRVSVFLEASKSAHRL